MYKSKMKRLVTTVEVGKPFSYRSVDRQLVVGEQGKGEASRRPYLYVVDRISCPCHCESSNWHGPNGAICKAETPGKRRCDGTRNAKKNNCQSSHIGLRIPPRSLPQAGEDTMWERCRSGIHTENSVGRCWQIVAG